MNETRSQPLQVKHNVLAPPKSNIPPELFQVVIECRDEAQQRELFERLRREGLRVRLLVL